MPDDFPYDVFLSHSANDKAVVRPLAERMRADGVKVWFDEWVLKPGDSIETNQSKTAKIEEGLERSRVLVLCRSANAFGSDLGAVGVRHVKNGQPALSRPAGQGAPLPSDAARRHPRQWLSGFAELTPTVSRVSLRP